MITWDELQTRRDTQKIGRFTHGGLAPASVLWYGSHRLGIVYSDGQERWGEAAFGDESAAEAEAYRLATIYL